MRNVQHRFRDLIEEHELKCSEPLTENVYLLLTNPLYNVHIVRHNNNFGHDREKTIYLADFSKFGKAVMKHASGGHIFATLFS